MADKAKPIRIRRAPHNDDNPYMMISRATAQNINLTYEAFGLLGFLLSKPVDWVVQPNALRRKGCGRDKVYNLINELIDARYVVRDIVKDDNQRVKYVDYLVYEEPLPDLPDQEKPDRENKDSTDHRGKHKKDKDSSADAAGDNQTFNKEGLDALFDNIAIWIFEVRSNDRPGINAQIPRAAVLIHGPKQSRKRSPGGIYLLEYERQHQQLKSVYDIDLLELSKAPRDFAQWWRRTHPGASMPIGQDGTFIGRWAEWRTSSQPREGAKLVTDPVTGAMITKAALAQREREAAEFEELHKQG